MARASLAAARRAACPARGVRHFVTSTPRRLAKSSRRPLARRDHHDHLPALELRKLLDGAVLLQILLHAPEQLRAELLVGHLAAPEAQRDLRLVALTQEAHQVAKLDLVISLIRAGPEFDLFDLRLLLLLAGGLSLLVLLEHELAVVHDPAYRGVRVRCDLDEVQTRVFGGRKSLLNAHDADLLAVGTDYTNPGRSDLLIAPDAFTLGDSVLLTSLGQNDYGRGSRLERLASRSRAYGRSPGARPGRSYPAFRGSSRCYEWPQAGTSGESARLAGLPAGHKVLTRRDSAR